MKQLILSAVFALGLTVPSMGQSIGGSYVAQGTNLDGSPYQGTAEIRLTSDTTCTIEWVTGSTTSRGICSRNGNAFAAAYVMGNVYGLVIYQVLSDGTLDGLWTIAGQPGSGTERLTPR